MTPEFMKTYTWKHFVMQVSLTRYRSFKEGIAIDVLPRMTLAFFNRDIYFGIGLDWIFGGVNFGYPRRSYVKHWEDNKQRVLEMAADHGLTERQERLRWGW